MYNSGPLIKKGNTFVGTRYIRIAYGQFKFVESWWQHISETASVINAALVLYLTFPYHNMNPVECALALASIIFSLYELILAWEMWL